MQSSKMDHFDQLTSWISSAASVSLSATTPYSTSFLGSYALYHFLLLRLGETPKFLISFVDRIRLLFPYEKRIAAGPLQ